jgi:hypothetical protein
MFCSSASSHFTGCGLTDHVLYHGIAEEVTEEVAEVTCRIEVAGYSTFDATSVPRFYAMAHSSA